jgi:hypothetical protein
MTHYAPLLLPILFAYAASGAGAHSALADKYRDKGELIVSTFASAPFPHPKRSEGHKYKTENYSAAEHYSDSTVAIFIPKSFTETGTNDFVVHFHGWRQHLPGVLEHYKPIEQLVESRRNAILIVPQGPKDAPDSFGGKLEDEGGFSRFMTEVIQTLKAKSTLKKKDMSIGQIILSGHSGGYQVISSIVDRGGLTDHVKEIWLFDALYAQTDRFLTWFEKGNRRFIDLYTDHGGTKEETEALMATLKAKNVKFFVGNESEMKMADLPKTGAIFIHTDLEHDDIVDKHSTFRDFLLSSNLHSIPATAAASR